MAGPDSLDPTDFRRQNPRFQGEALAQNARLVEGLRAFAGRHNATAAQIALAWLLAKHDNVVPIPGTRRIRYLDENVAATRIKLTSTEVAELDALFPPDAVAGTRYPEEGMKGLGL